MATGAGILFYFFSENFSQPKKQMDLMFVGHFVYQKNSQRLGKQESFWFQAPNTTDSDFVSSTKILAKLI